MGGRSSGRGATDDPLEAARKNRRLGQKSIGSHNHGLALIAGESHPPALGKFESLTSDAARVEGAPIRRRRIRRREALLELALARATSATNLRELLPEPLATDALCARRRPG